MRGPIVRPVVIAAGGTGGHFFPAEALAAELIRRGQRVVLMTDARSGGLNSAVFANGETHVLSGAGIAGRGALRAAKAVFAMAAGIAQARAILSRLNASVVVGFGGYPSVAPVLASRLLRRRPAVVLHEQNAVLGRANRFLSRHADRLALSFADTALLPEATKTIALPEAIKTIALPEATKTIALPEATKTIALPEATKTIVLPEATKTIVTGNPVRPAIAALIDAPYTPPSETTHLLILGGSLGARVFSDVVPAAVSGLPAELRGQIVVTQQCRAEDIDRVRAAYAFAGIEADLSVFFPDVAERLTKAHLVIARAGASTVAELSVAGRPAILVPLPGAIDDHQSANARALVDARGAVAMAQARLTPAALTETLALLLSDAGNLAHAARCARSIARPQAAADLADIVETLVSQEVRP